MSKKFLKKLAYFDGVTYLKKYADDAQDFNDLMVKLNDVITNLRSNPLASKDDLASFHASKANVNFIEQEIKKLIDRNAVSDTLSDSFEKLMSDYNQWMSNIESQKQSIQKATPAPIVEASPKVRLAQQVLNKADRRVKVDGVFGPGTKAALLQHFSNNPQALNVIKQIAPFSKDSRLDEFLDAVIQGREPKFETVPSATEQTFSSDGLQLGGTGARPEMTRSLPVTISPGAGFEAGPATPVPGPTGITKQ